MNQSVIIFGNKNTGTLFHKNLAAHNFNDEILKKHDLTQFVILKQIHSNKGFAVTPKFLSHAVSVQEYEGDFLITNQHHVGLSAITADCLPVIVVDQKSGVLGVAHAGWRGTVAQIVPTMITKMSDIYGSDFEDMRFYFGPHGRTCCYQVQPDFIQNLTHFSWTEKVVVQRYNKLFFDMSLCNQLQLFDIGIQPSQIIHQAQECTICDDRFHSHRRDGITSQRNLNLAWLTQG